MKSSNKLIDELCQVQLPDVFNPYTDICPVFDTASSPRIRRENLCSILDTAISTGVESIWIARDLGYRGGRRTGLALTDEVHIHKYANLLGAEKLRKATKGPAVAERTAAVIWESIERIGKPIFLWNVFPLHPHKSDEPLSNRNHKKIERELCSHFALQIMDLLKPRSIVAIGRDSREYLEKLGIDALSARHPSYGGQTEFKSQIDQIFGNLSKPGDHDAAENLSAHTSINDEICAAVQ